MHDTRMALAALLLATVLVGLVRIARGPTLADRLLVTQLFGTTGAAILLVLAQDAGQPALRDVALIFALLAPITVAAFVRAPPSGWRKDGEA